MDSHYVWSCPCGWEGEAKDLVPTVTGPRRCPRCREAMIDDPAGKIETPIATFSPFVAGLKDSGDGYSPADKATFEAMEAILKSHDEKYKKLQAAIDLGVEAGKRIQLEAGDLMWAFKDRDGKITASTKWNSEAEVWFGMKAVGMDYCHIWKEAGCEVFQVRVIRVS